MGDLIFMTDNNDRWTLYVHRFFLRETNINMDRVLNIGLLMFFLMVNDDYPCFAAMHDDNL